MSFLFINVALTKSRRDEIISTYDTTDSEFRNAFTANEVEGWYAYRGQLLLHINRFQKDEGGDEEDEPREGTFQYYLDFLSTIYLLCFVFFVM